jgi:hypothetical protein
MVLIVLQLLLVSLTGLLALDHRLDDRERAGRGKAMGSIPVDPGQRARRRAESDPTRTFACTRRSIARRPSVRHLPSTNRPRPHER